MAKPQPRSYAQLAQDRSLLLSIGGLLVVLLVSMVVIERLGGAQKLADVVRAAGVWAPVVFILAKALTYVIAPLSGTPVKVIAGSLFGFFPGLIYATLGDLLGASINFWIARLLGREALHKFLSKKSQQKVDGFVAHLESWKTLLLARVALSSFYDFISYTAGLSKLRYRTFFWVTLLGGIPGSALAVGFGSTLVAHSEAFMLVLGGGLLVLAVSYWTTGRSKVER